MEILILFFIWILVLYIIKLNKEIYYLRRKIENQKDIYVPTLTEIMKDNIWYLQLYRIITNQFNQRRQLNKQIQHSLLNRRKVTMNRLAALSDDSD